MKLFTNVLTIFFIAAAISMITGNMWIMFVAGGISALFDTRP